MSTPGFAAEFSLYNSDKSYRLTAAGSRPNLVRPVVMPQMKCEEYECGSPWWWSPEYCIRCESDRLK